LPGRENYILFNFNNQETLQKLPYWMIQFNNSSNPGLPAPVALWLKISKLLNFHGFLHSRISEGGVSVLY
jgi:hypothetical protein